MSDLRADIEQGELQPHAFANTAILPAAVADLRERKVVNGAVKGLRQLPLFCNPVALFLSNWILMLAAISVQITYVTYPFPGLPLLLCALSVGSFLFGYMTARATLPILPRRVSSLSYTLDITALWRINVLLCAAALAIIAFNWVTAGPPPALSDPSTYLIYGRFKQVLFPLLVCVAVNCVLDSSRIRQVLFALFGIVGMMLYVTRGLLIVMLLQMLFVFALKTTMSKRRLYTIALGCAALAVVAVTVIGNARTAQGVFLEYLQIRHRFSDWPMAYLWLTSYISIPFSNLCWIFAKGHSHGPTLAFLYPLLPSFLMPGDPHAAIHNDLRITDGASTYLAAYALDFSYLGVYLANLALGFGCGWLRDRALPKQILVSSVFLTCLSFIFFSDMFTPLSTIVQIIIQGSVQRRCFRWQHAEALNAVPQ